MLPWSTCGDTQGLVRIFIQPSSTECNFTSQLTTQAQRHRNNDMKNMNSNDQPENGTRGSLERGVEPSRCAADLAGVLRTFAIHRSSQS